MTSVFLKGEFVCTFTGLCDIVSEDFVIVPYCLNSMGAQGGGGLRKYKRYKKISNPYKLTFFIINVI